MLKCLAAPAKIGSKLHENERKRRKQLSLFRGFVSYLFSTADDIRYYRLRYYKQSFRNAFLCVTSNAFWRKEEKAGERRKVVLNKVCAEKHEKVAVSRDLIGDKERTSAGLIGKVSF